MRRMFTKSEIKSLITEFSSKLYVHQITYSTSPYPKSIFLISKDKEPYTYETIARATLGGSIICGRTNPEKFLVQKKYNSRNFIFISIDEETLEASYEKINTESFSDSVSPF